MKQTFAPARNRSHRQRGAAYLAVLGASTIILIVGVSAILGVRVQNRTAVLQYDVACARNHAISAVELARFWMTRDAGWRIVRGDGVWVDELPLGEGTISLLVRDPVDNDIADERADRVRVIATGVQGKARQVLQVDLQPRFAECGALSQALYATGSVRIDYGQSLTVIGAPAYARQNVRIDGTVIGAVGATTKSGSGTVYGKLRIPALELSAPAQDVFETYRHMGAKITIPPGNQTYEQIVISPNSNPSGSSNSRGIYYIEHDGDLRLRRLRVNGTLAIKLAPGRKLQLEDALLLHPTNNELPALIVIGDVEMSYASDGKTLSETDYNVNFNPSHTPYEGHADWDTTDHYPNEIRGVVYVRGTLKIRGGTPRVRGLVIVEGDASIEAPFTIIYENQYAQPYGFEAYAGFDPIPGSWRRVTQ